MPKVRNASGENVYVGTLGGRLVLDGAVIEVDADDVYSYTSSSVWAAADKAAEKATSDGEKSYYDRLRADHQPVPGEDPDPGTVPTEDPEPTPVPDDPAEG